MKEHSILVRVNNKQDYFIHLNERSFKVHLNEYASFYGVHLPTLFVIVCGNLDSDSGMSKSPLSDIWETHPMMPFLYFPIVLVSIDGKPPANMKT